MTDNAADEFFTKKHARLANLASIANFIAWVIFIVSILAAVSKFVSEQQIDMVRSGTLGPPLDFWEMLSINPFYVANLILGVVRIFLSGVTGGLVLKGISLGLKMVLETDLNYRGRVRLGEDDE